LATFVVETVGGRIPAEQAKSNEATTPLVVLRLQPARSGAGRLSAVQMPSGDQRSL